MCWGLGVAGNEAERSHRHGAPEVRPSCVRALRGTWWASTTASSSAPRPRHMRPVDATCRGFGEATASVNGNRFVGHMAASFVMVGGVRGRVVGALNRQPSVRARLWLLSRRGAGWGSIGGRHHLPDGSSLRRSARTTCSSTVSSPLRRPRRHQRSLCSGLCVVGPFLVEPIEGRAVAPHGKEDPCPLSCEGDGGNALAPSLSEGVVYQNSAGRNRTWGYTTIRGALRKLGQRHAVPGP